MGVGGVRRSLWRRSGSSRNERRVWVAGWTLYKSGPRAPLVRRAYVVSSLHFDSFHFAAKFPCLC